MSHTLDDPFAPSARIILVNDHDLPVYRVAKIYSIVFMKQKKGALLGPPSSRRSRAHLLDPRGKWKYSHLPRESTYVAPQKKKCNETGMTFTSAVLNPCGRKRVSDFRENQRVTVQ